MAQEQQLHFFFYLRDGRNGNSTDDVNHWTLSNANTSWDVEKKLLFWGKKKSLKKEIAEKK